MDCFNQPNCVAGARYYKQTGAVVKLGIHTDGKPDEHTVLKISFEAFLKNEARKQENEGITLLNLYKRAMATNFKGIWLPSDHRSSFLVKLRRIRKYGKDKKEGKANKGRPKADMVSIGTSPLTANNGTLIEASTSQNLAATVVTTDTGTSPMTPIEVAVHQAESKSSRNTRSTMRKKKSMTPPEVNFTAMDVGTSPITPDYVSNRRAPISTRSKTKIIVERPNNSPRYTRSAMRKKIEMTAASSIQLNKRTVKHIFKFFTDFNLNIF